MKKVAEEVKVELEVVKGEAVKVEKEKIEEKVEVNEEVEKAITEEQQVVEDEKKIGSLTEVKIENLKSAGDVGDQIGDEGAGDEKKEELKQTNAAENTKVPITEVLNKTKDCENGSWSSLTHREEEKTAGPCVG
ncbi:hypothetical protein HanPI659440_Chr15g0610641 [Helianthus annuus]|nr:hypothetical protein HanPI659440_Chr15g0610641 [Helianthus annuus]